MHFWIDKRSQCGYAGRHRVPPSISSGVGRARGRSSARKSMATPVHRFTAVATVDVAPRRPQRTALNHYPRSQLVPQVHTARRHAEEPALYLEITPEPPQPTIASLAAARSVTPDTLLRTAALGLHHSPVMAPHLKFGMLVSFALATVFLAGAKYYFDRQVGRGAASAGGAAAWGGEVGVVCVLVASVAGLGCAVSACRASTPAPPPPPPDRVSSTAQRRYSMTQDTTSEDASLSGPPLSLPPSSSAAAPMLPPLRTVLPPPPTPEAPPPYHIAVLLPRSAAPPSPPPPAYSALS